MEDRSQFRVGLLALTLALFGTCRQKSREGRKYSAFEGPSSFLSFFLSSLRSCCSSSSCDQETVSWLPDFDCTQGFSFLSFSKHSTQQGSWRISPHLQIIRPDAMAPETPPLRFRLGQRQFQGLFHPWGVFPFWMMHQLMDLPPPTTPTCHAGVQDDYQVWAATATISF